MNDAAGFEPTDPVLPGLDAPPPTASALELSTRRTIAALEALGLVDERHSMLLQLMLDLAQVVDAGRRHAKASAAAMAAAQLLAAYTLLMPETEGGGGDGDAFDQLASDLRDAARSAGASVAE